MKIILIMCAILGTASCASNGVHTYSSSSHSIIDVSTLLKNSANFHEKHIVVRGRAHISPAYTFIELVPGILNKEEFASADRSIDLYIEPGYMQTLTFIKGGECILVDGTFDSYSLSKKIYLGASSSNAGSISVAAIRLCGKGD